MPSINFVVLLFLMIGIGGIRGEPPTSSPINGYNDDDIRVEISQDGIEGLPDQVVNGKIQSKSDAIELVLMPGQSDYANCKGIYQRATLATKVRGMPVYYNNKKQRFIFFDGHNYAITTYGYWKSIFFHGATGGFYRTSNDYPRYIHYSNWGPRYKVRRR